MSPAAPAQSPRTPHHPTNKVAWAKKEVTQRLLTGLADTYGEVYDTLFDARNGYRGEEAAAAVRHTPAQIRTLLGIS